MAAVGHSRLLKYLIPDDCIIKMAEPIRVKFEYKEPKNVSSDVPGEQNLREVDPNTDIEKSTECDDNTAENPKYVFAPVITVTTNEATLTKGDMKLQKISVSENISEIKNGVFYTVKTPTYPEIFGVAISETQPIRSYNKTDLNGVASMEENSANNIEEKKRTRIPKLRFRQAASRVGRKSESEEGKSQTSPAPTPRRSSIPRLRNNRRLSTDTENKTETKENIKPEDEFQKIYDEIVDPRRSIDESILKIKVDDPLKIESSFEEIIHQYDENENQQTGSEKTKHSKIPMLKRKSEHDIEVPQSISRKIFTNKSLDEKSKVLDVISKFSKGNIEDTKPKQRLPVRTGIPKRLTNDIVSKETVEVKEYRNGDKCEIQVENVKVSYEKGIVTNDVAVVDASNSLNKSVSETVISDPIEIIEIIPKIDILETKDNIKYVDIIEEKAPISIEILEILAPQQSAEFEIKTVKSTIESDEVKVATIEDIENRIHQSTEKDALEIKDNSNEQNSYKVIIAEDHKTPLKDDDNLIFTSKSINSLNKKLNNDIDSEEDTPILRGKVSRMINRLGSREPKDEHKTNPIGTPKPKSVLSKIALFERQEQKDVLPPRDPTIPKCKPFPRLVEAKPDEFISSKPKIVNGVLKASIRNHPDDTVHQNENIIQDVENNNVHRAEIATIQIVDLEKVNSPALAVEEYAISQDLTIVNEVNAEPITYEESYIENNPNSDGNTVRLQPENVEVVIKSAESYQIEYIQPINDNPIETESYLHQNSVHSSKLDENPFQFPKAVKEVNRSEVPKLENRIRKYKSINEDENLQRPLSVAEIDLGDNLKGNVHQIIVRINSVEKINVEKKEVISAKERPRKKSVLEKIALFEGRISLVSTQNTTARTVKPTQQTPEDHSPSDEEYKALISELENAKLTHGRVPNMTYTVLDNGREMPVLAVGTALLDKKLTPHIVAAAIDLGYRSIDCAFIYGNEKEVGEGIKKKIDDGTVKREDLFIMSKLWSTCHRTDLVEGACRGSLQAMGLDYFDLYLIHNPMSFKEGADPLPRIANVLQYSDHDYLDAWFGMEELVTKKLVRSIGLSNFNSSQVQRVVEKARVKPVINQVECHPYLSQHRLDSFCSERKVKLCCFGVLGSKGTPASFKSSQTAVIDDPLVKVMAAGLNITPAQLLIRYQIQLGHSVVVKASTGARLWDNLCALNTTLTSAQVDALSALNRNKRTFTFTGMGHTHKNYPFRAPF